MDDAVRSSVLSTVYETEPLYDTDQPHFLNAVLSGYSLLDPSELLAVTQGVEWKMGRRRSAERRMGPRTLDIDILLYGSAVIETESLVVPHPRMRERGFVLIPLLELCGNLSDPRTGIPFREYLDDLPDQGVYTYRATQYNGSA